MNKEDFELQEKLRQDDEMALETLYLENKQPFLNYARKYNLTNEEILDIYQDAVIALHQNFVMKQLFLKSSTVKTFLFGIGKNMIYNRLRILKKVYKVENKIDDFTEIVIEEAQLTNEQVLLVKHFKFLGERCKNILRMFYYRNLTIKEIVELTSYKDENTVKSYKSRCLKRLKELIQND